jgi:hypothetical protein
MIGRESELRLVELFLDEAGSGVRALLLEGAAGSTSPRSRSCASPSGGSSRSR